MSPTLLLVAGTVAIFAAIFVALFAAGVFNGERYSAARSLALVNAFTTAPKSIKEELDPGFRKRVLDPLLGRLTGLGRRLTPEDNATRLRQKLDAAGNPPGWTPDRVTAFKAAGFAAGLLLALVTCLALGFSLMPTLVIAVTVSLVGYLAPNLWLHQQAYERKELTQVALPDALDLLTISVEAGLGFDAALAHVAKNTDGPLADEFARVLHEMQLGAGRSEAMRALGNRSTLPELKGFVTSMVQADAFVSPLDGCFACNRTRCGRSGGNAPRRRRRRYRSRSSSR